MEYAQPGHRCLTVQGLCEQTLGIPGTGWKRTQEWNIRNAYSLGKDKTHKGLEWNYGVDISLGPVISKEDESVSDLLNKLCVNEIVPDEFVYEVGMKSGMAVY
jgi:hypothetical protein